MTTPSVEVVHMDCLDYLELFAPDDHFDAIVTDPPYGLGFMGKEWDDLPPGREWAEECLRVLKPGGHLLAFGGTRTWHRLAVAIEDAGFEVRDSIAWLYGSGFPKSMDVSKAIDKAAGATREVVGTKRSGGATALNGNHADPGPTADKWREEGGFGPSLAPITAPATPEAEQWQGWGTALKPAFEPIVVARKPIRGTVAANVLAHGTGALNIDGCRIEHASAADLASAKPGGRTTSRSGALAGKVQVPDGERAEYVSIQNTTGRWPANVVLDEDQAAALDEQSGNRPGFSSGGVRNRQAETVAIGQGLHGDGQRSQMYGDSGGASRFFYVAKAPKKERPTVDGVAHPTVKPLALMRWLIRLVTPPGGTVLDPFAGSGTTVEAALLEGFDVVGVEREADYIRLIEARLSR